MAYAWEATGSNGFGKFQSGNHYWGKLGRQAWEAMDSVTFELGITIGTSLGGNGWQREAMGLVTFGLGITTGTAKES